VTAPLQMDTHNVPVTAWEIAPIDNLDQITVYFQDYELGKGKVTLECWGGAWSSYFGAMGSKTIQQFFLSCGPDYLVNKLSGAQSLKQTKTAQKYLRRVVEAAQSGLREVRR